MKHLLIYLFLVPVVMAFMIYKIVEHVINFILSISDVEETLHYQLNIFGLERLISDKITQLK